MGGWIVLLAALARPERIKALVLINPAQDFTERLMWPGLADHERQAILRDGETTIVEEGLGEYVLTRAMFEEARDWLLLYDAIPISAPIEILQGREDTTVPWRHQIDLLERLTGGHVRFDLISGLRVRGSSIQLCLGTSTTQRRLSGARGHPGPDRPAVRSPPE